MNLTANYGFQSTAGTYSVCSITGANFTVEKAVGVNYHNTINGQRHLTIFVLNPDNPAATSSATFQRNDASTYTDNVSRAPNNPPYADIYYLYPPVWDVLGSNNGPFATGLDMLDVDSPLDFQQNNADVLSAVRAYFNQPSVPFMDI